MEPPCEPTTAGAGAGPVTDHAVDPAVDPHVAAPSLVLPDLDGAHLLGPATIDSDADGLADTALVPEAGPGVDPDVLALATDLDHDGDVDVLTTLSADGSARTATLPDPPAPVPGRDAGWDAGWDAPPPPAPVLDPATGAWTRTV